jgi:hypothetical protein
MDPYGPCRMRDPSTASARSVATRLAGPCAVVLLALALMVWRQREPLREHTPIEMRIEPEFLGRIPVWTRPPRPRDAIRAVQFGDSLAFCPPATRLTTPLRNALSAAGITLDLVEVRHGAFRPLTFGFFLDEVLAGSPRLAIVEVNLSHLLPGAVPPRAQRFSPHVGRLSLERAWRLREVLIEDELTLLDPLLARVAGRFDAQYILPGLETIGRDRLEAWGTAVNARAGWSTAVDPGARWGAVGAATRARAALWSRVEFAEHVQVTALRDLVASLKAAGTIVLCYVSPVRLGPLRAAGWGDGGHVVAAIERLRVAVGASTLEWLDLHALIADDVLFRDDDGHMHPPGCERTAAAIAPRVQALLDSAPH